MSSMADHAWRMWGNSLTCWCLSDLVQIDARRNHVPNLCQPANNISMKDLVVLQVPHDRVVGIARQTSNGLYQLSEHDIPHLGSQSLARELHVRRWPLNHSFNARCLFPSGEMSLSRQELCFVPKRTCDPAGRLSTRPPERLEETPLRRAEREETAVPIHE